MESNFYIDLILYALAFVGAKHLLKSAAIEIDERSKSKDASPLEKLLPKLILGILVFMYSFGWIIVIAFF